MRVEIRVRVSSRGWSSNSRGVEIPEIGGLEYLERRVGMDKENDTRLV